jgi:hypothetical protein
VTLVAGKTTKQLNYVAQYDVRKLICFLFVMKTCVHISQKILRNLETAAAQNIKEIAPKAPSISLETILCIQRYNLLLRRTAKLHHRPSGVHRGTGSSEQSFTLLQKSAFLVFHLAVQEKMTSSSFLFLLLNLYF